MRATGINPPPLPLVDDELALEPQCSLPVTARAPLPCGRRRRANSCLRTLDLRDTRQERRRLSPFRESGTPTPVAAASHATRSPTAHNGAITGLQFVPDGTMLLSSGRDGRLRLWHAATGENMNVHYASAHGGSARAKQLAVGAGGCGVRSARVYFPSPDGVLTSVLAPAACP